MIRVLDAAIASDGALPFPVQIAPQDNVRATIVHPAPFVETLQART